MSGLVTVWRVENGDGEGPYTAARARARWLSELYDCGGRHPGPRSESRAMSEALDGERASLFRFGFASLESFHDWFHTAEVRRGAQADGFRLRRYQVPSCDVLVGERQVMFRPGMRRHLEERAVDYRDQRRAAA